MHKKLMPMEKTVTEDLKNQDPVTTVSFSSCERAFTPGTPCCTILNNISEGIFTIDLDKKITFVNRAAESITGFTSNEAIGQYCFDIFRSNVCQVNCPLEAAIETKKPVHDQAAIIINKSGREVSIKIGAELLKNDRGEIVGAIEIFRDVSLIEILRQSLSERYRFGDLISKSHLMQEIFEILPDIAESDSAVLIQGQSGTGKEVIAKTIHELSPRKEKPLIKVNCGAIPDTLLESELFGYVRGAFTDAKKDKKGRFSLADGGTIFLDEIGETSPQMQVKLLRVLEEKEFIPLGGTAPVKVDIRVIAASNRDLEKMVKEGLFREDLYYRLNVIKINLPPLSERREDIPLLVEHFISRLDAIKGKGIKGVSTEVMTLLINYDYPGNIRELENILERAYVLCKGDIIEKKHLPIEFISKNSGNTPLKAELKPIESNEAAVIKEVLQRCNGNRALAARKLGIGRSTLWRKIKRYGLS